MMHSGMMRQIAEKEDEKAKNSSLVAWRLIRLLRPYWKMVSLSLGLVIIALAASEVYDS